MFTKNIPKGIMTPTHNRMGFCVDVIDPFTEYFLQKASTFTKAVADLGCGYGLATRHLLAAGLTVIANDISETALAETKRLIPNEHLANVTLLPGDATQLDFPPNSLSGIMAGRLIHFFLSPDAFYAFFRKMYTWLQPGGVLCVTVHVMKAWSPPEVCAAYEKKVQSGVAWPGWLTKEMMWDYLKDRLPDVGYAFHLEELKNLVEEVGFRVEKCGLYSLAVPDIADQIELYADNSLGIVAVKPDLTG